VKKENRKEEKIEEEKKAEGPVVHSRVNCDGCGQRGIIGIRYKCSVCPDFDFCSSCEANVEHEHPFLKIKTLKQTPVKIFTIINDDHVEEPSLEVNGERVNNPTSPFNNLLNHGLGLFQGFVNGGDRE